MRHVFASCRHAPEAKRESPSSRPHKRCWLRCPAHARKEDDRSQSALHCPSSPCWLPPADSSRDARALKTFFMHDIDAFRFGLCLISFTLPHSIPIEPVPHYIPIEPVLPKEKFWSSDSSPETKCRNLHRPRRCRGGRGPVMMQRCLREAHQPR